MVDKKPAWLADTSFKAVFNAKIDAFVEQLLHGSPCVAPVERGLMVQAMLNAMYESAEKNGKGVKISLT